MGHLWLAFRPNPFSGFGDQVSPHVHHERTTLSQVSAVALGRAMSAGRALLPPVPAHASTIVLKRGELAKPAFGIETATVTRVARLSGGGRLRGGGAFNALPSGGRSPAVPEVGAQQPPIAHWLPTPARTLGLSEPLLNRESESEDSGLRASGKGAVPHSCPVCWLVWWGTDACVALLLWSHRRGSEDGARMPRSL